MAPRRLCRSILTAPAVVSTASRRRDRRRLPSCRRCPFLVSGPTCNIVLFGGPFCKLTA
jgi:hypothetical protein